MAQLTGVHDFALGSTLSLHYAPEDVYVFAADGALRRAPRHATAPGA